jgi:hypothetical protein
VSFDILTWGLKGIRPDFSGNTFPVDATPTGGSGGPGGNASNTSRGGTAGATGVSGPFRLVD